MQQQCSIACYLSLLHLKKESSLSSFREAYTVPKGYTYFDSTHKLVEKMYTKLLKMKLKINTTFLVAINFILFCVTFFFKKKKT
jgi:hypothetical protein